MGLGSTGRYTLEIVRTIKAEVVAAQAISDAQQAAITKALQARLGREVTLEVKVDESLIGGAVIRAGDLVIDGSIRERLDKLAGTLSR